MNTIFDWLATIVFVALAVLFLQRSAMPVPPDRIRHYLPPAIGCAGSNFLGNEGYPVVALAVLVAVLAYIFKVLRPMQRS